jgi:hypothetical protein
MRISGNCTDETATRIRATVVWRPGRLVAMLGG